jgi:hypothetical protein
MSVGGKAIGDTIPVMVAVVHYIAADLSTGVDCYAGDTQMMIVIVAGQVGPGESSSLDNHSNNQSKHDCSTAWYLMEQSTSRTKCNAFPPDRISKLLTCIESLEPVPGEKACRDSE